MTHSTISHLRPATLGALRSRITNYILSRFSLQIYSSTTVCAGRIECVRLYALYVFCAYILFFGFCFNLTTCLRWMLIKWNSLGICSRWLYALSTCLNFLWKTYQIVYIYVHRVYWQFPLNLISAVDILNTGKKTLPANTKNRIQPKRMNLLWNHTWSYFR